MKIKAIKIIDFTGYEAGKSSSSGAYSFTTTYRKRGSNWVAEYSTSADFEYCPNCGNFGHGLEECSLPMETISNEELSKFLADCTNPAKKEYSIFVKNSAICVEFSDKKEEEEVLPIC